MFDQRPPPAAIWAAAYGQDIVAQQPGAPAAQLHRASFVDLQGPATQANDHVGFLYGLARGMADSAQRERGLSCCRRWSESLTADPFTRFDEWLNEVEGTLGQKTALLSLDEFEALDRALTQGRFSDADVLGMLRNLIHTARASRCCWPALTRCRSWSVGPAT